MATRKRWRKVKGEYRQAENKQDSIKTWADAKNFNLKAQLSLMYASRRVKAFITDMFMINMPILYLTTYIFLDGKDAFTHNQIAILACGISYGIITSLFFAISSQTPGYRYAQLKLVRFSEDSQSLSKHKVGFIRVFVRYVFWIIGTSFLFGIVIGILRTDGRCLHDVLCDTCVIDA